MADARLVEQITDEIMSKLSPDKLWEMAFSCRTVCIEKDADRVRFIVECGAERIGLTFETAPVQSDLARYIDHTLLKPNATRAEIEKLCREALQFQFATVCINPVWVRLASGILQGSPVKVCSVAGFPLGATPADVKTYEARRAIFDGAREIDMVMNIGALKSGEDDLVREDIRQVVEVCHQSQAGCKVILETAFLTDEEKVKACTFAKEAGADFVKTSTGFGPGGATAEDVALMRRVVGPSMGVKAAGGIRDQIATRKMLEAGATRIGASAGVKIVRNEPSSAPGSSY